MEDKQIIDLLFARDESGLQHTQKKYERMYCTILRQALSDESDVEECGNDVLLSLWNSIPPQYPNHFPAYICRIARRIGITRYKYNTAQKRGQGYTVLLSELEGCIPAPDQMEARENARQLYQILNTFLQDLDEQTRVLFLRRYYYLESVKDLAERYRVTENFVSVRLHRARKMLKTILTEEGFQV